VIQKKTCGIASNNGGFLVQCFAAAWPFERKSWSKKKKGGGDKKKESWKKSNGSTNLHPQSYLLVKTVETEWWSSIKRQAMNKTKKVGQTLGGGTQGRGNRDGR